MAPGPEQPTEPMPESSRPRRRRGRRLRRTLLLVVAGLVLVTPIAVGGGLISFDREEGGTRKAATEAAAPRWPDSSVTGAKGTLQEIPGRTITTPGTVLRNVRVIGQITIEADNVRLENVYVKTGSYYGVLVYGRNARITDTTVEGTPGSTLSGITAYEEGTFEAERVDVFHSEDGVRMAHDCSLTDSYIHDLRGSADSHFDAVTADGYRGWRISGNRIHNEHSQTAVIWVGDPRYGPSTGVVEDNLLAGGGYSLYAGPGIGSGIQIIDNHFSTRFFPKGGFWGAVAYWQRAGNTWRGNVWADGPRAGQRVRP